METPKAAPTASHTERIPTSATTLRAATSSHGPSVRMAKQNMHAVPIAMFVPEPTELS